MPPASYYAASLERIRAEHRDLRSALALRDLPGENLKIELTGILVGVVLVVLMGVMSDFFDTAPFFGMAIMLLSLILVKVSFLVGSVQKQRLKSDLEDPDAARSDVPSRS